MKPVAITGLGVVSPFGIGLDALHQGIRSGQPPFQPVPEKEYRHSPGLYGAAPIDRLPRGNALIARSNDLCKLGYWAAHAALKDSGIRLGDGYGCALISGSAIGFPVVDQYGDMQDISRSQYLYHSAVNGIIAIQERVRGLQIMIQSQECASTQAIGLAAQLVASGRYPAALTGGVDIYSRSLHACYGTACKVSPLDAEGDSPHAIGSRPWQTDRNGFVYSEGSSYLVLEDLDAARARGARIYGFIVGWGSRQGAFDDPYEVDESGAVLAESIEQALDTAQVSALQVDSVIASANGSVRKDAVELRVLGEHLGVERATPAVVTGFKHLLGETLGAAGAFSTALACLHWVKGDAWPAVQADLPPPAHLAFSGGRETAGDHTLISDLGYHGESAALLLRRTE